jgi:hypothetical protein
MNKLTAPFLLCLIIIFQGCTTDEETVCVEQPEVSDRVDITIVRLEDELLEADSRKELISILNDNPVIAEVFLKRNQYPNDSLMIEVLTKRFGNPFIDSLQMEIDRVFGEVVSLEEELELGFSNMKYYYPETRVPGVKTVATGLEHDLYVSDSLVIIGLDYFLGEGAKFRPLGLYKYMLKRYSPETIAPSVMLLYGISPRYNMTEPGDKSMLADMISFGKAYYFAKHMLPCVPDSTLLSYTFDEIKGVRENEEIVWAHFVENDLLFETNHEIKKKYMEERPKTYEIGDKAPGRIGTWLGWQIVNAYMEQHPEVTLPELMARDNPRQILEESNYKP